MFYKCLVLSILIHEMFIKNLSLFWNNNNVSGGNYIDSLVNKLYIFSKSRVISIAWVRFLNLTEFYILAYLDTIMVIYFIYHDQTFHFFRFFFKLFKTKITFFPLYTFHILCIVKDKIIRNKKLRKCNSNILFNVLEVYFFKNKVVESLNKDYDEII